MTNLLRFLQKLDYMRMSLGICIVLDGHPIIFFFRDAMRLAPGNTTFTALGLGAGLALMVPFTLFRRLYRPNVTMFWMTLAFILSCVAYMFVYPSLDPVDKGKELIYYTYILLFLFLLINIPNDIITVIIPVVVIFTLISNLALVYSLMTDPTWTIGQRATISLNNSDNGSGNPHIFARNGFMGLVACAIWVIRPQTDLLFRLVCLFAGVLNLAVIVLTQTRSTILALIIAMGLFMLYNVRPAQIRTAVRGLFKPIPIIVMALGVVGVVLFFRRYGDILFILSSYVENFMNRNIENIYAFLGLHSEGAAYKAVLDDSVGNRAGNFAFLTNTFIAKPYMLIPGYGYKYSYLDVPMMEILMDQGIVGLGLLGGLNVMILRHSLRIMKENPNPLNVFLAYVYILILVQLFTNGRPYDIFFWFPLVLMIRFMGVEHLFPAYLSDKPVLNKDQFAVVSPLPDMA